MKIKLYEAKSGEIINAIIESKDKIDIELPSLHDNWRFDFQKHAKNKKYQTYVIYCEDTPEIIEGCLIFEMKNKEEPYMAYVEISPNNRSTQKSKKNVAECLIAFACRLSFIHGETHFEGWLAFDVHEENKEDEKKLMTLYSTKYNAYRMGTSTTMIISPEGGEKLINEFLK